MRLPFLRSKDPASGRSPRTPAADDATAVEAARTRARRRLIGALVLLVAGVIGFPLLFETQPRPLPVDTPIEVRPGDLAAAPAPAPRTLPALPPPDAGAEAPAAATPAGPTAAPAGEAPAAAAAPVAAAAATAPAPPASTGVAATTPPTTRAAAVAPPAAARATPPDDGARARALLEGAGAPAKADGAAAPDKAGARFVVQVGAYSDAATLREARQRVEQLGLKTYTQVVDTEAGKRTRVRIGPYASRDEADAAAAKVKRAGMPANILAL